MEDQTMATKAQKQEQAEAIEKLREWLKPGDTVYTVLRNVSRSGMQREIGVVLMRPEGHMLHPDYLVSRAVGGRLGKHDGIIVGGCGMDMGFHLVHNLGRVLFPQGFGEADQNGVRAESKEHAASMRHQGSKFRGRNGDSSGWDDDGGYALTNRWI